MKNIFYTLFLIVFCTTLYAQNDIPNAGFEEWEEEILYKDPLHWDTPNEISATFGQQVVFRSDDAHTGTYSVKMETKSVLGFAAPGAITLGEFEVDFINQTASISGGVPLNKRPASLKGYYKTMPVEDDSTVALIYFYRYNEMEQQIDTIAYGATFFADEQQEWTEFTVPIEYQMEENPDTMNIIMVSAASYTDPKTGSILYVDDLILEMGSGIALDIFQKVKTTVSPNPFHRDVNFKFAKTMKNARLIIYNDAGKKLHESPVNGSTHQPDLYSLPAGSYIYHLIEDGKRMSSGTFIKY